MVDKDKSLEDEVQFSWGSVYKGWIKNLKNDIDPAIVGVKSGFFGLHAVPTWIRQNGEGKMRTDKKGLSGVLGLLVTSAELTGYFLLGSHINEKTSSNLGYAVIGIPLVSQAVSWTYEAFVSAKKQELSKVVMTRLQKSFEYNNGEEYDLTNKQLVDKLANKLYSSLEEDLLEKEQSSIDDLDKKAELTSIEKLTEEHKIKLEEYKLKSKEYAKKTVMYIANWILDGLLADGKLGKKYNMDVDLLVGPNERYRSRNMINQKLEDDNDYEIFSRRNISGVFPAMVKIIKDTIEEKNGTTSIELFGTITLIYKEQVMSYEVVPSQVWRV